METRSDRCRVWPEGRHDHWFKCGLPGPSWLGKLARLTESGLAMTVPKERRKAVPYYGAVVGGLAVAGSVLTNAR